MTYGLHNLALVASAKTIASVIIPGATLLFASGALWAWMERKRSGEQHEEVIEILDELRNERQALALKISQLEKNLDSKLLPRSDNQHSIETSSVNNGRHAILKSVFHDNIQLKNSLS